MENFENSLEREYYALSSIVESLESIGSFRNQTIAHKPNKNQFGTSWIIRGRIYANSNFNKLYNTREFLKVKKHIKLTLNLKMLLDNAINRCTFKIIRFFKKNIKYCIPF